jgi:TonB family protein
MIASLTLRSFSGLPLLACAAISAATILTSCSDGGSDEGAATPAPASPTPASDAAAAQPPPSAPQSLETKPQLDHYAVPEYPAQMQVRFIEGEVRVSMRVTPEGIPENIEVLSATNQSFAESLLAVLPQWRFIPARKDGVAVARTVIVAIPFIINSRQSIVAPYDGQPTLIGLVRPAHQGKPGSVVIGVDVSENALISSLSVASVNGEIDPGPVLDSIARWAFIPARGISGVTHPAHVFVRFDFTESGNVLVQYPYPPRN